MPGLRGGAGALRSEWRRPRLPLPASLPARGRVRGVYRVGNETRPAVLWSPPAGAFRAHRARETCRRDAAGQAPPPAAAAAAAVACASSCSSWGREMWLRSCSAQKLPLAGPGLGQVWEPLMDAPLLRGGAWDLQLGEGVSLFSPPHWSFVFGGPGEMLWLLEGRLAGDWRVSTIPVSGSSFLTHWFIFS